MIVELKKYTLELFTDETYTENSNDNVISYEKIYFENSEYISTKIGIKIYKNKEIIHSAIIGSDGGATGVHKYSQIIEDDKIIICCSHSIFCLAFPTLDIMWQIQADSYSCFEIFKMNECYIVHGEMEISRFDLNGKIIWQNSGMDIFTNAKGTDNFEVTESLIRATDWQNNTYTFDFSGQLID